MLPISLLDSPGALAWDSLPLVKLTCFPFAHGHTLPFSQARLAALEGRELRIRMWSFEVGAPMDSRLGMLLCRGGHALSFVLSPGSPCEAMIKEKGGWAPGPALPLLSLAGEDLQGEFWGAEVSLPLSLLSRVFPGFTLASAQALEGCLWKGMGHRLEEFGCSYWDSLSLFPETIPSQKLPGDLISLERLELVSY